MSLDTNAAAQAAGGARFDALKGVTVLDISKVLAGPICAQYLGDLGAEVIKIEPVGVGDDTRTWPPFVAGESAVFLSVNKNKRSLALDLKRPEGLAVLHRMVAQSDVVIESFRTGVAERLGIDYETLRRLRPGLIHASISGFGRSGPLADSPGYDVMVQAFSGIMSITGDKGGSPVRIPISPLDQTTGIHTALGIVAALRRRDQTGEGTAIQTSRRCWARHGKWPGCIRSSRAPPGIATRRSGRRLEDPAKHLQACWSPPTPIICHPPRPPPRTPAEIPRRSRRRSP